MPHTKKYRHERITRINSAVGRDINRSIILNSVRQHQPISRSRISGLTNLNKSTVSSIVANLLDEELLAEAPERTGAIGRIPVNLSIRQGKHFVGAISFDSPCTRLALVDIDGTIRARDELCTDAVRPGHLVEECVARIQTMRSALGPHRFRGIGATVAGIVDSAQSTVVYASNLAWTNVDLGTMIRTHLPDVETVSVENDAKASALAELLLGKHGLPPTNLLFVSFGVGIGAGIAVNGRILGGNTHAAGEIGHMTIASGGERCVCGNEGCWEAYSSDAAIIARYASLKKLPDGGPNGLTIAHVLQTAAAGDEQAKAALLTSAKYVGIGLANLIKSFDPTAVVIGGTMTSAWDLVQSEIVRTVGLHTYFRGEPPTPILPTSLSDAPSLLGAAALCIRHVFTDYRISL